MTDFHSLYQQYAPQVHRFALFLCGDASLADDITSETFVRAWVGQGKIREATVKAYLFAIWIMFRDSPKGAALFALFGIACWVMFFVHDRRIRKTGI